MSDVSYKVDPLPVISRVTAPQIEVQHGITPATYLFSVIYRGYNSIYNVPRGQDSANANIGTLKSRVLWISWDSPI